MWLRVLHFIGLTNLTDDQVAQYEGKAAVIAAAREGPDKPVSPFYSYSHRDEELREKLDEHLVAIAYPRLLSKGRATKFVFHVYARNIVNTGRAAILMEAEGMAEETNDSQRRVGDRIAVGLHCPAVEFSPEEQTVRIENGLNKIAFIGIPLDSAPVTEHDAMVTIVNAETKGLIESIEFKIRIVDYAFGHISRPLISKISSAVLACGAAGFFVLTSLKAIDSTLGLTAGTAAATLTALILGWGYLPFRSTRAVERGISV